MKDFGVEGLGSSALELSPASRPMVPEHALGREFHMLSGMFRILWYAVLFTTLDVVQ